MQREGAKRRKLFSHGRVVVTGDDRSVARESTTSSEKQLLAGMQAAQQQRKIKAGLSKPQGRQKYNQDYMDWGDGELQYNRKPSATKISYYVHYSPHDEVGKILFYGHNSYGGPFDFLSSFYPSSINDPSVALNTFRSVEHFYQYHKALILVDQEEKILPGERVSSHRLAAAIRETQVSALDIVDAVREFENLSLSGREGDEEWCETWKAVIDEERQVTIFWALFLKYLQNPDLKMKLMMTGKYDLYEASPDDSIRGIGKHASIAMKHEPKWGENVFGKQTQRTRELIRKCEPEWPETYAFDYWRAKEEIAPGKVKTPPIEDQDEAEARAARAQEISDARARAANAKEEWLAQGGEDLMRRLETNERDAKRWSRRFEKYQAAGVLASRRAGSG